MSKPVISVEHLSKTYRLGQIGTGTLTNDLKVWLAKKTGKPNPMLRIGQTDHGNLDGETLWALRDVSFQVEQGEVLGIIGRNGAGKSTLLKILSRVTAPSSGCIKVNGRIASLLEVGTGFHPDLTGRENIYLNGAILGMTKQEITRKFDEIVDFAEIEKFVDTPVKRYSSGMYVRLAFAVAAHLESEILLVDEVLAVGDAEFQKKCLGKMGDVASKEGRTVLFVSHNMAAVRRLCNISCLIQKGKIDYFGNTTKAIDLYMTSSIENKSWINASTDHTYPMHLLSASIKNEEGKECNRFEMGSNILVEIYTKVDSKIKSSHLHLLIEYSGTVLFRTFDTDDIPALLSSRDEGLYRNVLSIDGAFLKPGKYEISLDYGIRPSMLFEKYIHLLSFEVIDSEGDFDKGWSENREGVIRAPVKWNYSIVDKSI